MEPTGMEGQALAAWEDHARSWDTTMGDEGNDYFSVLELPALERMISEQQRNRAFDLATGNGLVARWLAQEGFSVVATDGARAMLEHAKARTATWYENGRLDKERTISFELLDVTNKDQWAQFIGRSNLLKDGFDVVVMNMGIMDIPDLEPLAVSLKSLLKQDGWLARPLFDILICTWKPALRSDMFTFHSFVATVLHPLFFTSGARRQITVHEDPVTGQRVIDRSILLSQYQNVAPARQLLFSNDSEHKPPLSFHRSFQDLFAPFFRAGLILDALEEVNFDDTFREPSREYAARNFTEFPKILAFRLRRGYT